MLREPVGASPHLPAPAPPLPFLGKKIPPCVLRAAEKGLVGIDAVWLLMQTSAGGEHGAGPAELVTQMCRCPAGLPSQPEGERSICELRLPEPETFAEHPLPAQTQNLRLLSTCKPAFIISRRRDFDMAGRIILSLLLLSKCGDKLPRPQPSEPSQLGGAQLKRAPGFTCSVAAFLLS